MNTGPGGSLSAMVKARRMASLTTMPVGSWYSHFT
jgi:hypothetical protein